MAGIGLELEKIFNRGTLSSTIKGYVYSALIYCGPWLFTILSLFLLGWTLEQHLGQGEFAVARVIIIYIFCFSLITTGPLAMVITRHISDLIYENKEQEISGIFISSTLFLLIVQSVTVLPFLLYMDSGWILRINGFIGYLLVSLIWHLVVFITAVKDYKSIAVFFGIGMLLALILGVETGKIHGANGVLLGFNLGLTVICFSLISRILIEFTYTPEWDFSFLKSFVKYWEIALFGLFYNLGIWIDKILFWYSPNGLQINNLLYAHHPYDSSMFFAYLTTVPSLAYFFVIVETDYYRHYRRYYQSILQKENLNEITSTQKKMTDVINRGIVYMAQFQLVITLICIFLAPKAIDMLELDWSQLFIFRIGALSAMFQIFIMLSSVVIFYFDFRKDCLLISIILFLTNMVFTDWSINAGFQFYGYGYFASTLACLILSLLLVNYRNGDLNYFTFCREALRL